MKLHYARITQQGQTFAIVRVQSAILQDQAKADQAIQWLQTRYFQMPTALMVCDNLGMLRACYGRKDLALALIHASRTAVIWQEALITS